MSVVPIMGDAANAGMLNQTVGTARTGSPVVQTMTRGPVYNASMAPPSFAEGTEKEGPSGWWSVWARQTLQDYRNFGPVHGASCNILFADGSVRPFRDGNNDELLNNGFMATGANGFANSIVDLPPEEVYSGWSLK